MSHDTVHTFAAPGMTPEEIAWEPREVSLPGWMWKALDDLVEAHSDHEVCAFSTVDTSMARAVRSELGEPDQQLAARFVAFYSSIFIEQMVETIKKLTSIRPVCTPDEYTEMRAGLHGFLVNELFWATKMDLLELVAELLVKVTQHRGHRLSPVEDLNLLIRGAFAPHEMEAVRAAAQRLGVEDAILEISSDDDEG